MRLTAPFLLLLSSLLIPHSANGFTTRPCSTSPLATTSSTALSSSTSATPADSDDSSISSSRRTFLLSSSTLLLTSGLGLMATTSNNSPQPTATADSATPAVTYLSSVDEAITLLEKSCDRRFLQAIVASDYRFLYRGFSSSSDSAPLKQPLVITEPCDLLSPDTYGSNDAATFFQKLDEEILTDKEPVRPRNGHLGVTTPSLAAEWGTPVSVWPLGETVHFAWFRSGGAFYPRQDSVSRSDIIVDGINCGEVSLEDALRREETEIMFSGETPFLAVPLVLEDQLREGLKKAFII